ncbi:MAG: membrane protein insertion efficiency factor YidD [Candidatus Zixiibacteriota bacterium]
MNPRTAMARLLVFALSLLVRAYQLLLSPLLIGGCRHIPSCSEYTLEALRLHGPGHGLMLSLRRLSRCRPGGSMGYDPVPGTRE